MYHFGICFSAAGILGVIIPYVLIFISLYFAFLPKTTSSANKAKMPQGRFNAVIGTSAGLYGGFIGLGTAPALVTAFSALRGYDLRLAVTNSRIIMMVIHSSSLLTYHDINLPTGKPFWRADHDYPGFEI